MAIYNINLGIGWASSGVEYAQLYRAQSFRRIGADAKFVFIDFMSTDNVQHMTANIGFEDHEVIWIYQYFTDVKIAPTTYTLEQILQDFGATVEPEVTSQHVTIDLGDGSMLSCRLSDIENRYVETAELLVNGALIQKSYYSYTKAFVEYYTPRDNRAFLYQRNWFNEDGSVAYEEYIDEVDGKYVTGVYRFKDKLLYSKQEFVGYFIQQLNLTEQDVLILDRDEKIAQAIYENKGAGRVAVIVHADHFSESDSMGDTVLWNNYYEYTFHYAEDADVIITSTDAQSDLLRQQFADFEGKHPRIETIPVGSLPELKVPTESRRPYGLVTASRLASEKHIDWLVRAVVKAKASLPELTFDIYGEGGERAMLTQLIESLGAQDYIRLMGHYHLAEVYKEYSAYLSASTSEGFGLTLLEAVGSGLPLIGFDVRYGNPTFIRHQENGYLIPEVKKEDNEALTDDLTQAIVALFTQHNMDDLHAVSYEVARPYLADAIAERWQQLLTSLGEKGGQA